jgi:hypothetical protein
MSAENTDNKSFVAVFEAYDRARNAIAELGSKGHESGGFSIVGLDPAIGCMAQAAAVMIPGFGPLMVVGPAIDWVMEAMQVPVNVQGLSALGSGLVSRGVPRIQARKYEVWVKAGKVLLIGSGSHQQVRAACEQLKLLRPVSIEIQSAPPEPMTPAA